MKHLIVTRFAVPRQSPDTVDLYRNAEWLETRHHLFRQVFVPSVAPLGVPVILLCAGEVAEQVGRRIADLEWARVEVQDEWHEGWTADPDTTITRLDSDDALHRGWFDALDQAPQDAEVCISKDFLRWDLEADRLHNYRRREPSPLSAFRGGKNPYTLDHKYLEQLPGIHLIRGSYLLQIIHGGNVKNRRPKPWRFDRWVPRRRLADFGVTAGAAELRRGLS